MPVSGRLIMEPRLLPLVVPAAPRLLLLPPVQASGFRREEWILRAGKFSNGFRRSSWFIIIVRIRNGSGRVCLLNAVPRKRTKTRTRIRTRTKSLEIIVSFFKKI